MGLRFFFHLLCYSFHDLYVLVLLRFQPLVSAMIYSLGTYHLFSKVKLELASEGIEIGNVFVHNESLFGSHMNYLPI